MNPGHFRKWCPRNFAFLAFLIILVAAAIPARAQFTQGSISGRVLDPSGQAIVGAKVTLQDVDTKATQNATTDSSGTYTFAALQPHPYQLTTSAPGFAETTVSVTVGISQQLVEDVNLQVGSSSQKITVQASGAAVALQRESSTVSQLVTQTEINSLPVSGRSFLGLASLGPGSQPGGDLLNHSSNGGSAEYFQTTGQQFIPAGQSVGHTSFLQDGVTNVQLFTQAANILPDLDAIQEFSVNTTGMTAQFSQPGVINVITKSGSNRFHGTAYDFFRNADLNANNWFNNLAHVRVPKDNFNQFGGSIGGPIKRDKLFFFFDYEGQRERQQAATARLVPTAAEEQGDFSDWLNGVTCGTGCTKKITIYDPSTYNAATSTISAFPGNQIPVNRISDYAKKYFALLPAPTSARLADGYNYHANLPVTNNLDQYLGRADYNISQRDSIFGTYEYYKQPTIQTSFVPNLFGNTYQREATNAAVEETHTFSAPIVNIARFGYNRSVFYNSQLGVGSRDWVKFFGLQGLNPPLSENSPPYLGLTNYGALGNPYAPQGATQNLFQYADEVDILKAKHTIRVGFELDHVDFDGLWTLYNSGLITFNGQYTSNHSFNPQGFTQGLDLADFELGYPNSAVGGVGSTVAAFRENDFAAYINDNYKVSPRLNLVLGFRYQYSSPPKDKNGHAATYDLATASSVPGTWNPNRLNFAPRVGFAYTLDPKSVIRGGYGIYYTSTAYNELQFLMANPPNYLTQSFSFSIPNPVSVSTLFPAFTPGSSVFAPFAVDKHNPTPYTQQWNLDFQHSLSNTMLFDIGYVGNVGRHMSIRLNPNQAYLDKDPQHPTPIQSRRPYPAIGDVLAQYDIGNANYHALQASFRKTFSSGLAFQVSYTWSKAMDLLSTDGGDLINAHNPSQNYGPSDFNRTQLLVFNYVYDLPFGPGKHFLNQDNFITKYVVGGWQINGITTYGSGLPFTVSAQDLSNTGGNHEAVANRTCDGRLSNPTRQRWFDTACFQQPGPGLLGDSGRNILSQGREENWDFSLFKNVPLTQAVNLQVRGEFFNVFNQHAFVNPDATVGDAQFGFMRSATSPRTVQLAMKLLF